MNDVNGNFILISIVSILVYFLPLIIAVGRETTHNIGIFVVNLFLGWTFLGWVGALAWAVTAPKAIQMEKVK